MPELPEVETIKRTLETFVLNKTINQVTVNWGKIIQHPDDVDHFKSKLKGETIRRMGRKGKFCFFIWISMYLCHI